MKPTSIIQRLVILLITLMSALGANAQEAYACYTESDNTLTFYYDYNRSSRPGTTYDLNTGSNDTEWEKAGVHENVTKVIFDPSFAEARPTTTYSWFYNMQRLLTIEGMEYLNTSEVTNMAYMFTDCTQLRSLDLSAFNTSKVTWMTYMFLGCTLLRTIYVGDGWSTTAVTTSADMFTGSERLVGGKGTEYNSEYTDKKYARIDEGTSNPGYFRDINTGIVTGIDQVTSDKSQVQSNEWYTIDGQKLNGMPVKKGVYIQNGKKTINN